MCPRSAVGQTCIIITWVPDDLDAISLLRQCLIIPCRESFRELILTDRGRLRWTRLENLLQEGSKSQDFDPQQLWLLAEWVLGPQGSAVRGPLCNELVRLLDAVVAGEQQRAHDKLQ